MRRRRIIGRAGVLAGVGLAAVLVACTPDGRDISVVLGDVPSTLTVGEPVTVEAAVRNVGTAPAVEANLGIVVPLGVDVATTPPSGVTCGDPTPLEDFPDQRGVRCTGPTLAPGAGFVLPLTLTGTAPGVAGEVIVTGGSKGRTDPEGGGAPHRETFAVQTVAGSFVDLAVEAEDLGGSPPFGVAMDSRTNVANRGTTAASPVTVTQTFPAGFTLGAATLVRAGDAASGSCSVTGQVATCTTGALAVDPLTDAGDRWAMVVRATPTTAAHAVITHAATAPAPEPVPDPSPNTDTVTTFTGLSNLDIEMPADVVAGTTFDGWIHWSGGGFGQYLSASIPPNLRLDGIVVSSGTPFPIEGCAGTGSVSCAGPGPVIAEGYPLRATFTALAPGGPGVVSMFINSEGGSAGGSTTVETVDPAITSDVHPSVPAPAFAVPGVPLTIPGEVRTAGATAHTGVVVEMTAPAGTVVRSATWGALRLPCAVAGRAVSCAVGSVAGHAQVPFAITLVAGATGTATLGVEVTSATAQDVPDPWPDAVAVTFPLRDDFIDLGVTATQQPDPPTQGTFQRTTYTVRNHGSLTATGVVLTVEMPPGYRYSRASYLAPFVLGSSECTLSGQVLRCALGPLAAGVQQRIELQATTGPAGPAAYVATVAGDQPEPEPDEQPSTITLPVSALAPNADLSVQVTPPEPTIVGEQGNVGVRVTNEGPSNPAPLVTAVVTVPDGWRLDGAGVAGECTVSGSTATCTRDEVRLGQWSFGLRVTPLEARRDSPFTATVTSSLPDLDPTNSTTTALGTSLPDEVDLELTTSPTRFPRGGWELRTVTLRNRGPAFADDLVITGSYGPGAHIVSVSEDVVGGGQCTWTETTFRCPRHSIGVYSTQIRLEVTYDDTPGPVPLTLSVTSATREVAPDPHPNTVTIPLLPVGQPLGIAGTVVDPGGAPVAGARVGIFSTTDTFAPTRRVDTAADGSFSALELPFGTYRIQITPPTGRGLVLEWYQDAASRTPATPVVVGGSSPFHQLSIRLGPTPTG